MARGSVGRMQQTVAEILGVNPEPECGFHHRVGGEVHNASIRRIYGCIYVLAQPLFRLSDEPSGLVTLLFHQVYLPPSFSLIIWRGMLL